MRAGEVNVISVAARRRALVIAAFASAATLGAQGTPAMPPAGHPPVLRNPAAPPSVTASTRATRAMHSRAG